MVGFTLQGTGIAGAQDLIRESLLKAPSLYLLEVIGALLSRHRVLSVREKTEHSCKRGPEVLVTDVLIQLHHLPMRQPQASHLTSLSPNFLICKMGITLPNTCSLHPHNFMYKALNTASGA